MKDIDLNPYSAAELQDLLKHVEKEIETRQQQNIKNVAEEMRKLASTVGLSAEEVLNASLRSKKTTKAKVKYRNPENNKETWTGLGKRPSWLKAKIAAGSDLQDFLI